MTNATASALEFWTAAIHEAGHCAAHMVAGGEVGAAWVNEDGSGACQARRSSVISCLSGPVAEWKVSRPGDAPHPEDFRDCMHIADVRRAVELLGSDNGDLLFWCWLQACELIDKEWRAVMRVAEMLAIRNRLSGAQIESIWRRTPRPG